MLLTTSVTALMAVLSDCLRALTPHVPKAGIPWEEGKAYDDWDAISQTLFLTVVDNSIAYPMRSKKFKRLAKYGFTMPDYSVESYIFDAQLGRDTPFLFLATSEKPFDTSVFLALDADKRPKPGAMTENIRKPLRDCQFVALLQSDKESREITNVSFED